MPVSGSATKDRDLRLYSGDGTPFYIALFQVDIAELPLMEPRPPTNYQLDASKVSNNVISYINPEDQLIPFQPLPFSITLAHMSDHLEMLDSFSNPRRKGTWTVGGDTWTPVATGAFGTRLDVDGNAVNAFAPKDQTKLDHCVNMYAKYSVPGDAVAGTALVVEWKGVAINSVSLQENAAGLSTFIMEGEIYGAINPNLSDFPAGTESIPS